MPRYKTEADGTARFASVVVPLRGDVVKPGDLLEVSISFEREGPIQPATLVLGAERLVLPMVAPRRARLLVDYGKVRRGADSNGTTRWKLLVGAREARSGEVQSFSTWDERARSRADS